MSYVAITNRLTDEVESRIRTMRSAELAGENAPDEPKFNGTEPFIAPHVWGVLFGTEFQGHPSLSCDKPQLLYFMIEDTNVNGAYGIRSSTAESTGESIVNNLRAAARAGRGLSALDEDGQALLFTGEAPPQDEAQVLDFIPHVSLSVPDLPRWVGTGAARIRVLRGTHLFFEALASHRAAVGEIEGRWAKVRRDIVGFLKTCKSLNEAVKLWPDLQRYISADDKAKMAEKAEKPKKDQSAAMAKLAAMDLDTITASTVTARLVAADRSNQT